MIVVTGAPRSGTSLMMQILRDSLGPDRVVGYAQPPEAPEWIPDMRRRLPGITDAELHTMAIEMAMECPDGYWEAPWVMRGVPDDESYPEGYACKLVGAGLANTAPEKVDRVIYMLRDPLGTARSAARLAGTLQGKGVPDDTGLSTDLFIENTLGACRYLAEHSPPVLVVELMELCRMPEYTCGRVGAFIGEPVIKPDGIRKGGPRRISCVTDHGGAWDLAYDLYRLVYQRDWQGALKAHEAHRNKAAIDSLSPSERALIGV